jgi:hypothetical protein
MAADDLYVKFVVMNYPLLAQIVSKDCAGFLGHLITPLGVFLNRTTYLMFGFLVP